MTNRRPKSDLIRNPTLFEMDKVELTGPLVNSLNAEHRYSEQGFLLGTSAFSASGWECSFYPSGMKQRDYLKYYATKFKTVEIDSTCYGTPSASTVTGWYEKTGPADQKEKPGPIILIRLCSLNTRKALRIFPFQDHLSSTHLVCCDVFWNLPPG